MEPEEIDKLFRDRLTGLPAVPSADAWQRLQQKMEPPKKERTLWIYYAAASVVILLISGILLIRTNIQNQNSGLANNMPHKTKLPIIKDNDTFVTEENKVKTRIAEEAIPKQENPEIKRVNPAITTEQLTSKDLAVSTPKASTGKLQRKLPKANQNKSDYLAVSKESKNFNNSAENKITPDNNLNNTEPKAFTLGDNTRLASESALTATIVEVTVKKDYIDESAGDDNSLRENLVKKTMLLKNIYKQARNLKNGEPVELTALGVDKDKLQAETKEIKQKINKVISL